MFLDGPRLNGDAVDTADFAGQLFVEALYDGASQQAVSAGVEPAKREHVIAALMAIDLEAIANKLRK